MINDFSMRTRNGKSSRLGKTDVELGELMIAISTLAIFDEICGVITRSDSDTKRWEGAQDAQGAQLDEQVKNITKQLRKVEGAQGAHHFRQT